MSIGDTPTTPDEYPVGNIILSAEEIEKQTSKNDGDSPPPDSKKSQFVTNVFPFVLDSSHLLTPDDKSTIGSSDNDLEGGANGNRPLWKNPWEFLFSCISMSVGLGNVWRFPFVAYANGGGAFLIPYLIVLVLIGRPIYFMELCLGQFCSYGSVKVWNMSPIFKGVGYGSMFGVICVVSYYCSIMGQTVFYFVASFSKELPWTVCDQQWGGDLCLENGTVDASKTNQSVATLYYELEAFPRKPRIDDGLGMPDWRLSLCLLFSWFVIFATLARGVRSSGKVAYFTAIFPYVVLIILLIRGVTLPGAIDGILYFIEPKWEAILQPKVWFAAVGQCFFSLGTGFGLVTMLSSYNTFRHNVYRDTLIISFMDTFTSLLA